MQDAKIIEGLHMNLQQEAERKDESKEGEGLSNIIRTWEDKGTQV